MRALALVGRTPGPLGTPSSRPFSQERRQADRGGRLRTRGSALPFELKHVRLLPPLDILIPV
jgi:hypothetical protein